MKKIIAASCLGGLAGLAPLTAHAERKISLFTALELGRLESGYDLQKDYDPSGTALNRTYVDVGFTEELDERFRIAVGVGGIFWKANEGTGGAPEDKVIKFGPGISQAYMQWMPSKTLDFTFGFFPYKYNAAAKNLGEYLFRSESYPTILYTGGWSWMNDVQYRTVGAKLTLRSEGGAFRQDFGLFGEYFNAPIYDITPAYVATWKPGGGFTLGAAAAWHRLISPDPQTRKKLTKSYTYYEDFHLPGQPAKRRLLVDIPDYLGNEKYRDVSFAPNGSPNEDSVKNFIWSQDSAILSAVHNVQSASAIPLAVDSTYPGASNGKPGQNVTWLWDDIKQHATDNGSDSAAYLADTANADQVARTVSFDNAAIKLGAFFELDFNALFGLDGTWGAFNLYGEIAQLGLKNYPIFYTDYAQRRPVMLGVSVPTFGLLNHLSFELEYLDNPTIQSIASTYDKLDLPPDENFRYQDFARDDVKWTVHAARSFSRFFTLYVQVANDHMRLKDGFTRPQYIPVTNEPGHWYWLTRIQWAL